MEVSASSIKLSHQHQGVNSRAPVLKQHYFTPQEGSVPTHTPKKVVFHEPIPVYTPGGRGSAAATTTVAAAAVIATASPNKINNARTVTTAEVLAGVVGGTTLAEVAPTQTVKGIALDGFYLLESTGFSFPEDAQQVNLADKKLSSVVDDDMMFFSRMSFIDVSENRLSLYPFGAFPNLQELRIACNGITDIPNDLRGFQTLFYLDLSYNKLNLNSVVALGALPCLKELDLSGNNLQRIPEDWEAFAQLERLILDYNKIESNESILHLCSAPRLRYLSLANNFLSHIPEVVKFEGYRLLETLDLAFNYFGTEESIEVAILLPRLTTLVLYGNPVLGPTGEDAMFIYIEDLVERALDNRTQSVSNLPDIDFVTEIPRRRVVKKGQPLGRMAIYRDFSIVRVAPSDTGSNREWRARGMKTMFAESVEYKRLQQQEQQQKALQASISQSTLPDSTFITTSAAVSGYNGGASKTHSVVANNVMEKVVQEMGLINSAELLLLKDKATLPPSAISHIRFEDEESFTSTTQQQQQQQQQRINNSVPLPYTNHRAVEEQLPSRLFARTMGGTQHLTAQPVALKTAMKALQAAIRQPLTNYDDSDISNSNNQHDVRRGTRSSQLRQMPRKPAVANNNSNNGSGRKATTRVSGAITDGTEDYLDSKAHRYNKRGLKESAELAAVRQDNRDRTLSQIDSVLHGLNENTATWSESQHKKHVLHKSEREIMSEMRNFAQPYTGVKSLMNMVEEVVNEFNS